MQGESPLTSPNAEFITYDHWRKLGFPKWCAIRTTTSLDSATPNITSHMRQ